jgi:hypothetical protein
MKNIQKILVSLLVSFAISTSAFAGELTVTGTAKATYNSVSGNNDVQNSGADTMGITNELTFGANGELDNGWTWKYATELDPDGTAAGGRAINDDTQMVVTTPYGAFAVCVSECGLSQALEFDQGAYTLVSDTGYAEGKTEPGNISSYTNMQFHTPAGLLPNEAQVKIAYAPGSNASVASGNAANAANTATAADSTMVSLTAVPTEGAKVGVSYMKTEGGEVAGLTDEQDHESGAVIVTYKYDAFAFGIGKAYIAPVLADGSTDRVENTENTNYSVGYNVNDNLSVSYTNEKSKNENTTSATATTDLKVKSVQAAYTMGGMTVAIAASDYDNVAYVADQNVSEVILAVTMAF